MQLLEYTFLQVTLHEKSSHKVQQLHFLTDMWLFRPRTFHPNFEVISPNVYVVLSMHCVEFFNMVS